MSGARVRVLPIRLAAAPHATGPRLPVRERLGLLLVLEDAHGVRGVGEASPLPGFSRETIADAREALERFAAAAGAALVRGDAPRRNAWSSGPSSAVFAIESALADLRGRRLGRPAHEVWREGPAAEGHAVPINALVPSHAVDAALAAAERALARGIDVFKVKVGGEGAWDAEHAVLLALRARHGERVTLRADANRAWPREVARERLATLAALGVAYVEEPFEDGCWDAPADVPLPLAADESLQMTDGVARALACAACLVFVIKPMAQGGAHAALETAARARAAGRDVTVTHLFGGPVAHAATIDVALALAPPPLASGLDRHALLDALPGVTLPRLAADRVVASGEPGLGLDHDALFAAYGIAP